MHLMYALEEDRFAPSFLTETKSIFDGEQWEKYIRSSVLCKNEEYNEKVQTQRLLGNFTSRASFYSAINLNNYRTC